jgi:hypothetical protein
MAPFDSLRSLMAGLVSAESNALRKRTCASKGVVHALICFDFSDLSQVAL